MCRVAERSAEIAREQVDQPIAKDLPRRKEGSIRADLQLDELIAIAFDPMDQINVAVSVYGAHHARRRGNLVNPVPLWQPGDRLLKALLRAGVVLADLELRH